MEIENRQFDRILHEISRWEVADDELGEDERDTETDIEPQPPAGTTKRREPKADETTRRLNLREVRSA